MTDTIKNHVYDLGAVLWELLTIEETIELSLFFNKNKFYRLKFWPLFIKDLKAYKAEALQLTAIMQAIPCSLNSVKLPKSNNLIRLFALLNILQCINEDTEPFEQSSPPKQINTDHEKTGFLSKFKAFISKLG